MVPVKIWAQMSYQGLKKWYMMPSCLTLSIIRYGSRVKWSNPKKGVAPSPTPYCSSYRKGSLQVTLDYGHQLYLLLQIFKNRKIWISRIDKALLSDEKKYCSSKAMA